MKPTKKQIETIRNIFRVSGLFICKVPKTREEADQIIFDFVHIVSPRARPRMISTGLVEVGEMPHNIKKIVEEVKKSKPKNLVKWLIKKGYLKKENVIDLMISKQKSN